MIVRALAVLLSLAVGACATRGAKSASVSQPRCARYVVPPDPRGVVDTEATINPTDSERTERTLRILHDAILRYRQERGRFPDSLPLILELGPPAELPVEVLRPQARWLVDAWGTRVAYSRDAREYRLASGGPDRVIGTVDDIVTRGPCTGSGYGIRLWS